MTEINVKTEKTERQTLFADLDKPSLHALSYALRHPDTWPKNFNWNYGWCTQCAMGLAHQLWRDHVPEHHSGRDENGGTSKMAKAFGMPFEDANRIFFPNASWTPLKTTGSLWWKERLYATEQVTPEMVADQIDKYLTTAE